MPLWAGAASLFLCTAYQGATHHASAFALRILVCTLFIALWPKQKPIAEPAAFWVPLICWSIVTIGFFRASNHGLALQPWLSATFVVMLYSILLLHEYDVTDKLFRACVWVGVAQALWGLVEKELWSAPRGTGGFFNPNDLGAFLAPLCVVTLFNKHPRSRLTLVVLVIGLWSTGSRSGMLALSLALVIFFFEKFKNRWLFASVCGILASLLFWSLGERWLGAHDPYAYARLQIWQSSVRVAIDNFFGVGLTNYELVMRQTGVPLPGLVRYPKVPEHAHNELINAWVELGFVGLIAIVLPPLMLLRRAWPHAAYVSAMLVAFAVPALTSNTLHVPPIALLSAVFGAQIMRRHALRQQPLPLDYGRTGKLFAMTLSVLLLATTIPGLVSTLAQKRALELQAQHQLKEAYRVAKFAYYASPWSLTGGMLLQNLRYANGASRNKVVQSLVRLGRRFPANTQPLLRAAWLLENQDPPRYQASVRIRRQIIERDPLNCDARVALGIAELRAGEKTAALQTFRTAVGSEPYCSRALAYLAAEADAQGDGRRAHELALKAQYADQHSADPVAHVRAILSLDPITKDMVKKILIRSSLEGGS
jgi:O-antigen ligase